MRNYDKKTTLPSNPSMEEEFLDLPTFFISTPWNQPFISTGYSTALRNMFIPFPYIYDPLEARHVPDARNGIVTLALNNKFDYLMMLDADHHFPSDLFVRLWEIVREDKDAIATAWAIMKGGKYEGNPCIFKWQGGELIAFQESEIRLQEGPFEVAAFGTCGFLCHTDIFRKLQEPWFTDVNVIREDQRLGEFYLATEFAMGQDLHFGLKARQAGIKLLCHPKMKMPHERVSYI